MSKIIQAAQPSLLRLERGQVWAMTDEERAAVAAWVTMCVITFEQADRKTAAIDQNQRALFMLTKRPPPNFHIFIGVHDWATRQELTHHKGAYMERKDAPAARIDLKEGEFNLQSTTFNFGHLVAHCVSYRNHKLDFRPELYGVVFGLQQIWPQAYNVQKVLMAHDDLSLNILCNVMEWYGQIKNTNHLAQTARNLERHLRGPEKSKRIYSSEILERCKVALSLESAPHPLINKGLGYTSFVKSLELAIPRGSKLKL